VSRRVVRSSTASITVSTGLSVCIVVSSKSGTIRRSSLKWRCPFQYAYALWNEDGSLNDPDPMPLNRAVSTVTASTVHLAISPSPSSHSGVTAHTSLAHATPARFIQPFQPKAVPEGTGQCQTQKEETNWLTQTGSS
jgi:hypothetical protein